MSANTPAPYGLQQLRAEATVVSMGSRVAFAQGKLTDSEGRLCAAATSSLLVFDRKPS